VAVVHVWQWCTCGSGACGTWHVAVVHCGSGARVAVVHSGSGSGAQWQWCTCGSSARGTCGSGAQ